MVATIREVAEGAGVSTSTVSRSFTRPDKVDDATRRRVLDVAERLGYAPSGAARSLKTGRTGALGIVLPDLSNPFFPDIVRGAQRRAHEHGYAVLLADSEEDPAAELPLVRALAPNVDALILCSARMTDAELAEAAAIRPIVLINREPAQPMRIAPVTIDNAGGIDRAVRHLAALGHRRVGFVSGPATSASSQDRLAAFRVSTAALGVDGVLIGTYEPTVNGGAAAADDALIAQVSAVVVYNDIMAAGLLGQLNRLGVEVPGRLSVIGFDDISISALLTPALTTVRIPLALAGSTAVDRLDVYLSGAEPAAGPPGSAASRPGPLPTELVVRASTAVYPGR